MGFIGLSLSYRNKINQPLTQKEQMKSLYTLVVFCFLATAGFSQSLASLDSKADNTEKLLNFSADDWSFFHDAEHNTFYIDFETVDVNLSDLKVINESGEVVLQENLQNLPVNTIFELSLEGYPVGTYDVQIRTFTSVINKAVEVK